MECVRRLQRYYRQYKRGYFTFIHYDRGGRHYVGRFTTPIKEQATSNGKWDVQGVTFEEMPGVPMLQYPEDWEQDGIWLHAFDDGGDQQLAVQGAWAATQRVIGDDTIQTMDNPGATAGDWATYEYVGYGFQLQMLTGPEYGQVTVYLDDVQLQVIDLYAAQEMGPQMVLEQVNVSLDFHRVKVVVNAAKNASSIANAVSWCALRIMQ
jgi:hypothetical protein